MTHIHLFPTAHAIETHGIVDATLKVATYAGASGIVLVGAAIAFWTIFLLICFSLGFRDLLKQWWKDPRPFYKKTNWAIQATLYFVIILITLVRIFPPSH